MNTPGISLVANSEHCSAQFENGEQLWRENLCMPVLMETKTLLGDTDYIKSRPHGGDLKN